MDSLASVFIQFFSPSSSLLCIMCCVRSDAPVPPVNTPLLSIFVTALLGFFRRAWRAMSVESSLRLPGICSLNAGSAFGV